MQFIDGKDGILGLMDAAARGYPATSGAFAPTGNGDLRPAVYAPEASYTETAASAVAALFPEDFDPLMAARLAARAFAVAPERSEHTEDIVIADFTSGPSGSAADSEAAFLAGILAAVARRSGPRLLLADGTGPEGAALSEAIVGLRDLRLVLLYPADQAASGVRSQRLAREGGQLSLVTVHGDGLAVDRLIREAAGKTVAGMAATAAGPANPARFAARIVALASTFSMLRIGVASDFFMGIGAGDGLGFAACLWAWRLGLPLTGIVLSVGEKGVLELDAAGRDLVDRFDAERPGVIRSLALLQPVDRESALRSRAALEAEGGPALDLASAMTLVAAERSLEAGLRGHARILVPRGADPRWDASATSPGIGLRDARVDAEIEPTLTALERALTA
ncbi:MAG: hypothetical protein ABSF43_06195 [Rectinemataceae bacterium]|jgi:threonine synthase